MNIQSKTILSVAIFAAVVITSWVTFEVVRGFNAAKEAALHSYLSSVCQAVEDYRVQHGQYPANLGQIETSTLDYDRGIALSSLEYDIRDSELTVTYSVDGGTPVSLTRKRIGD